MWDIGYCALAILTHTAMIPGLTWGRYPASVRWIALLKTAGWEITNEGENGRCIPRRHQEVTALSQAVQRTDAEILVVMLGSNDLLQQAIPSAEVCTERMEQFLTVLLEEVPPDIELVFDSVHFSEIGHHAFAEGMQETLKQIIFPEKK